LCNIDLGLRGWHPDLHVGGGRDEALPGPGAPVANPSSSTGQPRYRGWQRELSLPEGGNQLVQLLSLARSKELCLRLGYRIIGRTGLSPPTGILRRRKQRRANTAAWALCRDSGRHDCRVELSDVGRLSKPSEDSRQGSLLQFQLSTPWPRFALQPAS